MKETILGCSKRSLTEQREFPRRADGTNVKVYLPGHSEITGNAANVSTGGIAIVVSSELIVEPATKVIIEYMGFNFSGTVTSSVDTGNLTRLGIQWDDEVRKMLEE